MSSALVVQIGIGADEPERCAQAWTVAATAIASGARVSVWLMGEGVWAATAGALEGVDLPGSAPLALLRDAVLADGALTVCTQCAARRGLSESDLLPGVTIAGAATYVEEILQPNVQALVY